MMAQYLTAYGVTAVVFLVIDFIWLSQVARGFYFERLGELLLDKPNLGAATAFYAIYVVGVVIFSVAPALRTDSATTALTYGALFGFFAYATYDMTNYATLRNWSLVVSLVDTAWGACLTGVSALLGFLVTRFIFHA
jgi:uncharacterized membrane protein